MIDLSSTSFGSEPTDAGDPFAGLSQSELADVLESMEEVGLLGSDDDGEPIYPGVKEIRQRMGL